MLDGSQYITKDRFNDVNLEGANLKGTNFNEAILHGVIILEHDYKYLKDYIDKKKVILK
ncbi:pentapeptide repeat-containing protein [Clostridium sp. 5N-1]|uniref:Pentapeptide repeat-containing protein n=1 Tax=Clostridium aquiflavi TaxID=3073603 RepID=A0ABU1EKX2_9CLOT|nr:pentapeptide repeat-containing protein [Clostridium sp. 5N-1]